LGGRGRRISEFEASLVYRVSSRAAKATQRNPVSKNPKKKKKKKKKKKRKKFHLLCYGGRIPQGWVAFTLSEEKETVYGGGGSGGDCGRGRLRVGAVIGL
jgi:hypothetical protein